MNPYSQVAKEIALNNLLLIEQLIEKLKKLAPAPAPDPSPPPVEEFFIVKEVD